MMQGQQNVQFCYEVSVNRDASSFRVAEFRVVAEAK